MITIRRITQRHGFWVPVRSFKTVPTQRDFEKQKKIAISFTDRIKHEINHYWRGTKELGRNIQVSRQLVKRMIRKDYLNWREIRLLRQTSKDVLKAVPFAAITIMPFSEFFIPIIVRLIPGILPSTYVTREQKLLKLRRVWSTRVRLAEMFRESVKEVMIENMKHSPELGMILSKLDSEQYLENSEILLLGEVLGNKFRLSVLNRKQLLRIKDFFHLSGPGIYDHDYDYSLQLAIRKWLRSLRTEDSKITEQDIEEMSIAFLIELNQERGMRVIDRTEEQLRKQLRDWIELSCLGSKTVPPYLLLISRCWNFLAQDDLKEMEEVLDETQERQPIKDVTKELKEIIDEESK